MIKLHYYGRSLALAASLVLAALPAANGHQFKAGTLTLTHPWTRATPPGAKVGGGYVEIANAGGEPDRLIGGSVPFADKVEVHEMGLVDGVMTMRQITDGLEIPAGGTVVLKPGSYHLMFVGLKDGLVEDTVVDGTLTFEHAGDVAVSFSVQGMGAKAAGEGHGEGH